MPYWPCIFSSLMWIFHAFHQLIHLSSCNFFQCLIFILLFWLFTIDIIIISFSAALISTLTSLFSPSKPCFTQELLTFSKTFFTSFRAFIASFFFIIVTFLKARLYSSAIIQVNHHFLYFTLLFYKLSFMLQLVHLLHSDYPFQLEFCLKALLWVFLFIRTSL